VTEIKTLGVLGAGQMGAGIAQVAAEAGIDVRLADSTRELAQKGKDKIAAFLSRAVEKGKMDGKARDAALARIVPVDHPAGLADVDLAVEAVSENETLKLRLFAEMDGAARPGAILASNTSSISITKIAAATRRPERVIGMHFMNPVPLMKLVEVIRGLQTSDETYAAVIDLAGRMGKATVTSKDSPGFIVNRVLIPMLNEACFALQEGIGTAEDIDRGIVLGLNHPMGPLALADLVGLDTCLAIAEVLHKEIGEDKYRPCPLLRNYVAAGWLGRKAGRGFYAYSQ